MSLRLENKVAFITGGTSGIGLSSAKEFASQGAQVVLLARSQEKADAAIAEIGHAATAVIGDVSDTNSLKNAFNQLQQKNLKLDVVFACAGIGNATMFAETSPEQFDELVNTNFKGPFFTVQYALPLLNEDASVILVSSCLHEMGMEGYSVYNATKAAVRSIVRSLTPDLTRIGARINLLSPGPIETPVLARAGMTEEQIKAHREVFARTLAAGRSGQPEEMAKVALFLASDDSSYMYGSDVQADGGMNQVRWPMA